MFMRLLPCFIDWKNYGSCTVMRIWSEIEITTRKSDIYVMERVRQFCLVTIHQRSIPSNNIDHQCLLQVFIYAEGAWQSRNITGDTHTMPSINYMYYIRLALPPYAVFGETRLYFNIRLLLLFFIKVHIYITNI